MWKAEVVTQIRAAALITANVITLR